MKVQLQKLVGAKVHDVNGKLAGRIHSVQAEIIGGECIIKEWLVGPAAMLSRLGITAAGLIGIHRHKPTRIPWEKLDVATMRLTCSLEELSS